MNQKVNSFWITYAQMKARAKALVPEEFWQEYAGCFREAAPTETKKRALPSGEGMGSFLRDLAVSYDKKRAIGEIVSVWEIAGLREDEVRVTSVLSWLLNARKKHGFGDRILRALAHQVSENSDKKFLSEFNPQGASIRTEYFPSGDFRNRIDLVIETIDHLVFIEVKVRAPEGASQRKRYADGLVYEAGAKRKKSKLLIYIAPREPEVGDHDVHLSWKCVAKAINECIIEHGSFNSIIAEQFAKHIEAF